MLLEIARKLDRWTVDENLERRAEGLPLLHRCEIRVFGQAALLEQKLPLHLAATNDVDVIASYQHPIEQEFRRLLQAESRFLDPVAHEAWMPAETVYEPFFVGEYVTLLLAEPEAILLSKSLKAPNKNRALITEYLARGASDRFLYLAKLYGVDLEAFL